jgi:hypothetical protein
VHQLAELLAEQSPISLSGDGAPSSAAAAAPSPSAAPQPPPAAQGGKKSAKELASEEEAAAAAAMAAEAAAAEEEAAAAAEAEAARQRMNWREHLEDRCAPYEWTPLMFAARHGSPEDLQLLLDAGASVNARDIHGATSLHKAACAGPPSSAVAKLTALVAAGADLEASDRYGMTALHVAAFNERVESVRSLMKLGASQFSKCGPLLDGDTPLQLAQRNGLDTVAAALRSSEVRRKKLKAGGSHFVPADTPYWQPPAFSAKRMNPRGVWGPPAGA